MKTVFPIALSLCLLLSFSGLNATNNRVLKTAVKQQTAKFWWSYETSGTLTGSPYGTIQWYMPYQGNIPLEITFVNNGAWYGPNYFQVSGSGSGVATAAGPRTLGIIEIQVIGGNPVFTTTW